MKHGRFYLYPRSNRDRGWSPFTVGTYQDLKEANVSPIEGKRLQFYDEDADDQGNPDDLLFEGTVHFVEGKGWGAIIEPRLSIGNPTNENNGKRRLKVDLAGGAD